MIADGVVASLGGGHRAHTPAREERLPHQMLDTGRNLRIIHDPGPEEMPYIGGERVHPAPITIEGQRKECSLANPVVAVETLLELRCLALEALGQRWVIPEQAGQTGAAHLGVIHITLDLTGCPWRL